MGNLCPRKIMRDLLTLYNLVYIIKQDNNKTAEVSVRIKWEINQSLKSNYISSYCNYKVWMAILKMVLSRILYYFLHWSLTKDRVCRQKSTRMIYGQPYQYFTGKAKKMIKTKIINWDNCRITCYPILLHDAGFQKLEYTCLKLNAFDLCKINVQ